MMGWFLKKGKALDDSKDERTQAVLDRLESVADRMERFAGILEQRLADEVQGGEGHTRTGT